VAGPIRQRDVEARDETNAVAAPSGGIQIGQNGPYVFLIRDDSTAELRLVRVDRTVGNKTVIAEGLPPAIAS
jgi:multidrug efflux system membrane fusion protein